MLIATCSVRRRVMVGGRNCTGRQTRQQRPTEHGRTRGRTLTPSVATWHCQPAFWTLYSMPRIHVRLCTCPEQSQETCTYEHMWREESARCSPASHWSCAAAGPWRYPRCCQRCCHSCCGGFRLPCNACRSSARRVLEIKAVMLARGCASLATELNPEPTAAQMMMPAQAASSPCARLPSSRPQKLAAADALSMARTRSRSSQPCVLVIAAVLGHPLRACTCQNSGAAT
jgi:hypothetical protein